MQPQDCHFLAFDIIVIILPQDQSKAFCFLPGLVRSRVKFGGGGQRHRFVPGYYNAGEMAFARAFVLDGLTLFEDHVKGLLDAVDEKAFAVADIFIHEAKMLVLHGASKEMRNENVVRQA